MISMKHIILVVLCYIVLSFCMRVIPERTTIDFIDENYVTDVVFNVRRNGRKSNYYVNMEWTLKHAWGDNVSLDVFLYEFLHNEYRRSFVEFHFKGICKMLKSDPYLGKAYFNAGLKQCPLQPKHYVLSNMSLPVTTFPYIWPFERAKGVGIFYVNKTVVAQGTAYMRFVQK